MKSIRILLFVFFGSILIACSPPNPKVHSTVSWNEVPDQFFIGKEFFANHFLDWKINNGKLNACPNKGEERTLNFLTRSLKKGNNFIIEVYLSDVKPFKDTTDYIGIHIGSGKDNFSSLSKALVHNAFNETSGILVGLRKEYLFIKNFKTDEVHKHKIKISNNPKLSLIISKHENQYLCRLSYNDEQLIERLISWQEINNSIGLGYQTKQLNQSMFNVDSIRFGGDMYSHQQELSFGPVFNSMYTLNNNHLRLTAQLPPINHKTKVHYQIELLGKKHPLTLNKLSNTLHFESELSITNTTPYAIYINKHKVYEGEITSSSKVENYKAMVLSCNAMPFIWGREYNHKHTSYAFDRINDAFSKTNPNLVVFLGDQMYESRPYDPIYKKGLCNIDYQYRWAIWCMAFNKLTKNNPTIVMMDDHDYYQGNLWGNGGVKAKTTDSMPSYYEDNYDTWQQDNGGFFMDEDFLKMATTIQTSHLPKPHNSEEKLVPNYYTNFSFKGVEFAILEDKKFKSPPSSLDSVNIFNGFPLDSSATWQQLTKDSLTLLGSEQIIFLSDWLTSNRRKPKVVLTQSPYIGLTCKEREIRALEDIPAGERQGENFVLAKDMDSNGWPKYGRDKAIKTLLPFKPLLVSGDQHLANFTLLCHNSFNEGIYCFSTPSIANSWPRYWLPNDSLNLDSSNTSPLGNYFDGFGNRVKVLAVANPVKVDIEPKKINSKAPGFSIIEFKPNKKKAKVSCYPLHKALNDSLIPFEGWPIEVPLTTLEPTP